MLTENKAVSKSQQRLMYMVYAYKKGKLKLDKLPIRLATKILKIANGEEIETNIKTKHLNMKDARDFASTKHKGLPERVRDKGMENQLNLPFEHFITKFDEFSEILEEKSYSKTQQRLFGMVYAYKNGKLKLSDLSDSLAEKIKKIADGSRRKTGDKRKKTKGITLNNAKDFASTKHEGLPEKVEERIITKFNQFINESLLDELKGPSEEEVWNNLKHLSPRDLLIKSARNGLLKGVKKALENGADIHAENDCALMISVFYGHLDVVKYLVEHGADIHVNEDYTLRCAASNGHLDVVKYLVKNGADIHAENEDALICAAMNNHIDVVKYLVEHGANVHADNDEALKYATNRGYLEVVEYLKKQIKKEKVNESLLDELKGPSEEEVWTELKELLPNDMLIKSAKSGLLKGVKKALENGADIHAENDYAIELGASSGYLDVVKYLVEHGADIHADNDDALICAAMNNHIDVVKYLIEHGADIHAEDDDALTCAAMNNHIDIVKYLVEHGANVNTDNNEALEYAANRGYLEVVEYLKSKM